MTAADYPPGTDHYGVDAFPVDSKTARRGIILVRTSVDADGPTATIHTTRNPSGWYARRWLRRHPIQYTVRFLRAEWDDWQTITVPVEVV